MRMRRRARALGSYVKRTGVYGFHCVQITGMAYPLLKATHYMQKSKLVLVCRQ